MSEKSQRAMVAEARRTARDAQTKRRADAQARDKRIEDLAVTVMVAVAERNQVVEQAERRAGEALRAMTEAEGLSLSEAVEWCGDTLDQREATRLRRIVQFEEKRAAVAASAEPSRDMVTASV